MALNFKHYTYKITFPGMPWFYWGVHTDNGKPYFGSPYTYKWIWDFYDCEIQILEWFENREEAEKIESRLIRCTWNDFNCLNRHCGSSFKIDAAVCKRGGISAKGKKKGFHGRTAEEMTLHGRIGGAISGRNNFENKKGIFGMSDERFLEVCRMGKAIYLIHPSGEEEFFPTITAAVKKYGLNPSRLSGVLNGKANHHKKFKARFAGKSPKRRPASMNPELHHKFNAERTGDRESSKPGPIVPEEQKQVNKVTLKQSKPR